MEVHAGADLRLPLTAALEDILGGKLGLRGYKKKSGTEEENGRDGIKIEKGTGKGKSKYTEMCIVDKGMYHFVSVVVGDYIPSTPWYSLVEDNTGEETRMLGTTSSST